MDFIEGLPKSNGKDTIWFLVDHLSNCANFVQLWLRFFYIMCASCMDLC